MIIRIINYFKGYVCLFLESIFLERFINMCISKNIYLWDIKKQSNTRASLKMSAQGYKKIPPIARITKTRVKIKEKRGFFMFRRKYGKRYFLYAGLLLCVTFMFIMSNFIWSVEVVGNERVPTEQILDVMGELGLKKGCLKRSISVSELKDNGLLRLKDLSWMWVDIKGTKATIKVDEKIPIPEMIDFSDPCDIIATKDAVIKQIDGKAGLSLVTVGQTVKKGHVLITGRYETEKIPLKFVHSMGKVYGRTWYEKKADYSLNREEKIYSGNEEVIRYITVMGKKIRLGFKKEPEFENCDTESMQTSLFNGKIIYSTDKYKEYTPEVSRLSIEEVTEKATSELEEQILREADPDSEISSKNVTHTQKDADTITVTLTMELSEQIGVQAPLSENIENLLIDETN